MPATALKLVPPSEKSELPAMSDHRANAQPLEDILPNRANLSGVDLANALTQQSSDDAQIGNVLLARGMVSEPELLEALSTHFTAPIANLELHPVDLRLTRHFSPEICLRLGFLPWFRKNGKTWIVCCNPAGFEQVQAHLPAGFGPVELALVSTPTLERHIARIWASQLSGKADQKCPPKFSCRSWARPLGRPLILGAVLSLITFGILFPFLTVAVLYILVMVNLIAMSLLRLTALGQQVKTWLGRRRGSAEPAAEIPSIARLPKVSVLVPLYKEHEILPRLITRLARTDYPKELLDICLVLEESDTQTQKAVQETNLPPWMRIIQVPASRLKTKPRAMNYALDFCRGDIVGIYDAEDAPEPDQIMRIVQHFRRVGPEVACIQAYLDYYNPRQNWLARCFSIEYAIWFRLVLQGVERMRLPVPLGGTSVFFRRGALEKLGAWDAHNVTEDADLGMRLARFGYRCAFEPTTTYEEANCHTIPWIKQRSRWLKGYAMTWITHMRTPRALWRELGPKGFLTFHVILLGTLSSFLLAPAIWSFWLIAFGFTPAFVSFLPDLAWTVLGVTFVSSELILALCGLVATSGKAHRFLIPWVPTMVLYWPLGTIAAYKALYELLLAPFYWDKTHHGISDFEP